jgi:hypothetical protein
MVTPECYKRPVKDRVAEWYKLQDLLEKQREALKNTIEAIKKIRTTDKHLMTIVGEMDKIEDLEATELETGVKAPKSSRPGKRQRMGDESTEKDDKEPSQESSKKRLEEKMKKIGAETVDKSLQELAKRN